MSKITIIGKGLVGKNLLDYYRSSNTQVYDSKTINLITQEEHDIIFCAAPSSKKWIVNQNKKKDLDNIMSLIDVFKNTKFKKLVLLSTIDVYQNNCIIANEQSQNYSIEPYGLNRRILETEIKNLSESVHIIRLPALFGNYLEKNYMYDLLNNNMLYNIKLNSSFQWYPIKKLRQHIEFVLNNNISLMNLAVEPISTEIIVDTFFSNFKKYVDCKSQGIFYDMRSSFVENSYFLTKEEILTELNDYIKDARNNN